MTSPQLLTTMLDHALSYARRGLRVFPLKPGSKAPRVAGGFKVATTDEKTIRRWWTAWPDSGIGIASGTGSGIVIIDVDPRNQGGVSFVQLVDEYGLDCSPPMVHTGGGGTHFYFAHPSDAPVPCRSHVAGYHGVDIKADGGYVVAPPSIHPTGAAYQWDEKQNLENTPLPQAPQWLVDLARRGPQADPLDYESTPWNGRLSDSVAQSIARFQKVGRRFHRDTAGLNDTTESSIDYSLACQLARIGHEPQDIEAAVRMSRQLVHLDPKPQSYFALTVGKAMRLADEGVDAWALASAEQEVRP